ncbi:zinc finger, CCHC-type containing protein [Tanacetum coccineum]
MLMTMDPDIQKNLEHLGIYDMLKELKTLYVQQANQELFQTVREFHALKQEEGQSVSSYVLKMKRYIDNLEPLEHAMTQNLSVSLILVSLRKEYDGFVQNYNMHSMGKTVTELHDMLKLHEKTLPPRETAKGNKGKGKAKKGNALVHAPSYAPKPKYPPTPKKDHPEKDALCHQCGEVGHWIRNCPIYLAELMKKKKLSQGASTSEKHKEVANMSGLLNSMTIIVLGKNVLLVMLGKMARKPYSHQVGKAFHDLLGLINDVCGPFQDYVQEMEVILRHFTDDLVVVYGYVYLLIINMKCLNFQSVSKE